jgi:hypothetical protein
VLAAQSPFLLKQSGPESGRPVQRLALRLRELGAIRPDSIQGGLDLRLEQSCLEFGLEASFHRLFDPT